MAIKRLNQLIIGFFIIGVFCFFEGANAASFNCDDATTDTELTICANDRLSALDTALNTAYRDIFKTNFDEDAERARTDQRAWLATRDECTDDLECLLQSYTARLDELENINYDRWHENFHGSFALAIENPSMVETLSQFLRDYDLLAIDTVIYLDFNGRNIKSAILFQEDNPDLIQQCGMSRCNDNPTYFGVISGGLNDEFTLDDLSFLEAGAAYNTMDASISVHADGRLTLSAYYLRGSFSEDFRIARYSDEFSVEKISAFNGGVSSPGLGTTSSERVDYENNVVSRSVGYVFACSLETRPVRIGFPDIDHCTADDYDCLSDPSNLYYYGVDLYGSPSDVYQARDIFRYLANGGFEPAIKAEQCASEAIQWLACDDNYPCDGSYQDVAADTPEDSLEVISGSDRYQNLVELARIFGGFWWNGHINANTESTWAATDEEIIWVKLLAFYDLIRAQEPRSERIGLNSPEPDDYTRRFNGYRDEELLRRSSNRPSVFGDLVELYASNVTVLRPVLIAAAKTIWNDESVPSALDNFISAYEEFESQPDDIVRIVGNYRLMTTTGEVQVNDRITYWQGFDLHGFWLRRQIDGTADIVYDILIELRNELG